MTNNTLLKDSNAQLEPWQQLKFTGSGLEFFKIWIVNLSLTLLTLGIYSAWATVRTRRYFYGNTHVANSCFDFHGKAIHILRGRVIALVLVAGWSQGHLIHPYLSFVSIAIVIGFFPWLMVRALHFRLRNTSLHNFRFNFAGTSLQAYKLLGVYLVVLTLLISGLTSFLSDDFFNLIKQPTVSGVWILLLFALFSMLIYLLMYPVFVCDIRKFYINHVAIGHHRFSTSLERKAFIGAFFRSLLIFLFLVIIAVLIPAVITAVLSSNSATAGALGISFDAIEIAMMYILLGLAQIIWFAYWQTFIFNATFRNMELDGCAKFKATLATKPLAWLLITNSLMVLFSLGLAYPWAAVRLAKYKLEAVSYQGDFSTLTGRPVDGKSALGEEVGTAFDVEFGF